MSNDAGTDSVIAAANEIVRGLECGEAIAACRCVLERGHDGFHECMPECDGSWLDDGVRFQVARWPRGGVMRRLFDVNAFWQWLERE